MTRGIMQFAAAFLILAHGLTAGAQDVPDKEHIQIGSMSANRILFLGNSITLHGPAPDIGWTGDWGMAASSQEKDYVHLIVQDFVKATGKMPEIRIRNIAEFERGLSTYVISEKLKDELQFQPDIVIVAIGENAARPESAEAKKEFSTAFSRLIETLEKSGKPTIFVRSQFWSEEVKDELMKEVTLARKHHWVDLSKLVDESCFARTERKIEHAGVAGHPGDKGMSVIATALFKALNDAGKSESN